MKKKGLKIMAIFSLCVAVLGLSIAYAALSTTLNLNGTAQIKGSSWDVHFAALSEPIIVGGAIIKTPTILTGTDINFAVDFTKPGDSITYIFDVINKGTLPAKIGTITTKVPIITGKEVDKNLVGNNLKYELTYNDGNIVVVGDTLLPKETRKLKIKTYFDEKVTGFPIENVTYNGLGTTIIYVQS
ncbi:MAG: hypothetical protein RR847_00400 [Bacilli bacterium]